MNPFTIFQKILDAIKENGQKQDLTNQKLDKIINELHVEVTGFTGKWGTPTKQEKE